MLCCANPVLAVKLEGISPEPENSKYIAVYSLNYKNKQGEEDYQKITKISGPLQVSDDDGYLTMVVIADMLQGSLENEFKSQNNANIDKDFFYHVKSQQLIAHQDTVMGMLEKAAARLSTKILLYSNNYQDQCDKAIRTVKDQINQAEDYQKAFLEKKLGPIKDRKETYIQPLPTCSPLYLRS